ncbi:acyltransferase [Sphingomonas rhizophila]|uniref:Acyltransferase n=1 Tax=Sphingomonas rhizophila TaxID=2071607 RepID=A0A7G9S9L4_9SPHN|nr:acyltransferase [Sphingomonas rhizophila]QNN64539.1 acyltransferase [Sphingomonas rhizophila]
MTLGETRAVVNDKVHFVGLDGLRGVAAIAVMIMHLVGLYLPNVDPPIPAFLAVDMFFMLSGFVLAYAYFDKLDTGLSWRRFMEMRLVRLYPLLLAGILLGALVSLTKQYIEGVPIADERPYMLLPALALLPTGLLFAKPEFPFGTPYAFAFNFPVWSLFFEIVASAVFATRLRNAKPIVLVPMFVVSLIGITTLAYWDGSIGGLGVQGLIIFCGGFLRIFVPFTIGVLLYRTAVYRRSPPVPFWVVALVLSLLLLTPRPTSPTVELAFILVAFPLIICAGAEASMSSATRRVCDWIGRLSYPLYLLHLPLSRATGFVVRRFIDDPVVLIVTTSAATIFGSWIALKLYDEPVRRWLTGKLRARRSATGTKMSRA